MFFAGNTPGIICLCNSSKKKWGISAGFEHRTWRLWITRFTNELTWTLGNTLLKRETHDFEVPVFEYNDTHFRWKCCNKSGIFRYPGLSICKFVTKFKQYMAMNIFEYTSITYMVKVWIVFCFCPIILSSFYVVSFIIMGFSLSTIAKFRHCGIRKLN